MAIKDIFDMTAGTSTGSILAAGLAYPDLNNMETKKPAFFADDLLKIYAERGGEIFVKKSLNWLITAGIIIILIVVFGSLSYIAGNYIYDNK